MPFVDSRPNLPKGTASIRGRQEKGESIGTSQVKERTDVAKTRAWRRMADLGRAEASSRTAALRCDSVTDENSPSSASREGHMITIALSPMVYPKPCRINAQDQPLSVTEADGGERKVGE